MPIAAVQVHLDAQSMRHAWHAELWAERLPVLAGADPDGLDHAVGPDRRPVRRPLRSGAPPPDGPGSPVAAGRGGRSSGTPGPCPGWPACTGWSCPDW